MKSGFAAILGRPNVGKSTLINALLSKKISIVTQKSQTTRDDIMGVYNEKDLQIVFIDTPGLFDGSLVLDKEMVRNAKKSLSDVDCLLYMVDCSVSDFSIDDKILNSIKIDKPVFLLLNKIDLANAPTMEKVVEHYSSAFPKYHQIQISALTNFGLKDIKDAVASTFSEGPAYFPNDYVSDKDHSFMAKEVIRQELLHFLKEEVPHQCAVGLDEYDEEDSQVMIKATIYCEKPNQKAIIIGKGGQMIKKISMSARHELERMWHKHVTLVAEVEVAPNWRNDPNKLKKLGYGEPKNS
ncbi:MAG: GTPase Era [Bacilli bacterium]|jgi:GTP-binding protein Era|nr:GTPase Era [Bacilli bacterium]MCH4211026.1 GTPase Era [Bacilli bacterium]MCH4228258.1 GTPase Era [Bacilli bacterium]MCH4277692.1 GTPase Era [Bacilli bacterium]MCI2054679.1 GTPase Era [Bacilli bacterium]